MSEIDIPELAKTLAGYVGKKLDDANIPTRLVGAEHAVEGTAKGDRIETVFGAKVALAVDLFNYPATLKQGGDKDPDRLLMAPAEQDPPDAKVEPLRIRPQLIFAPAHAWVKTEVLASATAKATANIGTAGGKLDGDRTLRLLSYRRHARSASVDETIAGDLVRFANPLSVDGVRSLGPGEACALSVRGHLEMSLTLQWSDVFAGSLGALADLAGRRADVLALKIPAGASAEFKARIEDDLLLCFSREDNDPRTRVALRKSGMHQHGFKAKAGITVEFADPNGVSALLGGNLVAALLDEPQREVEALIEATSLNQVPAELRPAVEKLLARLAEHYGIEAQHPLQPIRARLKALRDDATATITRVAKTKVEAGIAAEYLRTTTTTSLFEARLDDNALKRLHEHCVRFDLRALLAPQPGVEPLYYLHEKTVKSISGWGVSFKFGSWLELGGKQSRSVETLERDYIDHVGGQALSTRAVHCALVCNDVYASRKGRYGFNLRADHEDAVAANAEDTRRFVAALEFEHAQSGLKRRGGIEDIVQMAPLWGVGLDTTAVRVKLEEALDGVSGFDARYAIALDDAAVRHALATLRALPAATYARHLARALPWSEKHLHRAEPVSRARVCAPVVLACMQRPYAGHNELKDVIRDSLRYANPRPSSDVYNFESGDAPISLFTQVSDAGRDGLWNAFERYRYALASFGTLLRHPGKWEDFQSVFEGMSGFLSQPWGLSAAMSAIAEACRHDGLRHPGFSAALTVSWKSQGKPVSLVIAGD